MAPRIVSTHNSWVHFQWRRCHLDLTSRCEKTDKTEAFISLSEGRDKNDINLLEPVFARAATTERRKCDKFGLRPRKELIIRFMFAFILDVLSALDAANCIPWFQAIEFELPLCVCIKTQAAVKAHPTKSPCLYTILSRLICAHDR
jgi:hypothetical protein